MMHRKERYQIFNIRRNQLKDATPYISLRFCASDGLFLAFEMEMVSRKGQGQCELCENIKNKLTAQMHTPTSLILSNGAVASAMNQE